MAGLVLRKAIKQIVIAKDGDILGIRNITGSLGEEYSSGEFKITEPRDALVLARAIVKVGKEKPGFRAFDRFAQLLGMLLNVGSIGAADVVRAEALPWLYQFFDRQFGQKDRDVPGLARLLRIFAMFGEKEGFMRIAPAIRTHMDCQWLWTGIFGTIGKKHPCFEEFMAIPLKDYGQDFVRVALVDHLNRLSLKNEIQKHPFETAEGVKQLRRWLTNPHPEEYSYARSATAALAFVGGKEKRKLLDLARKHKSVEVQLEAAWVAGREGDQDGINFLKSARSNPELKPRAEAYLKQLEQTR